MNSYGATEPSSSTVSTASLESARSIVQKISDLAENQDQNDHHSFSDRSPKPVSKFTTRQKLILISLCLFNFTSFCCMSILAPFFPREAENKGVTITVTGLIFGVYAFVIFLVSPVMGIVVTKAGPKCVFMIGVAVAGTCCILFGLLNMIESTGPFIFFCFVVRALEALGAAGFAIAGYAFVAEVFPDDMSKIWGALETFVGLGMSVGPAIGGALYDWGGYGLPFYVMGSMMLVALPVNFYLLPSQITTDRQEPGLKLSMWKLLKIPPVAVVALTVIVAANTWAFLDPTLEPHLRQFGLTYTELGGVFMLMSIMYGLSSPGWGMISARLKRPWIFFVIGMFYAFFGLILVGPSPLLDLSDTIWMNIIALVILGLFVSMALLPTFEAMLDFSLEAGYRDDVSTYGLIAGLWSSMYSLGEIIGQWLGSVLTEYLGFPVASTINAFVCLLMAILVFIYFLYFYKKPQSIKTLDADIGSLRETTPILKNH